MLVLRSWAATLVVACTVFAAGLAYADDNEHDQDIARQAVERGEIRALADILAIVRSKLPGKIVRVKIERKKSRWYYEFRIVDAKGRLFEAYVDARTGEIERIKEK
jgi:uncharacterized membrane protein YkoI